VSKDSFEMKITFNYCEIQLIFPPFQTVGQHQSSNSSTLSVDVQVETETKSEFFLKWSSDPSSSFFGVR
jgi:hypothetical protein